jgi:hypothetical protein
MLDFLLERKNIRYYCGVFHIFCENWLTDTISTLGGLMESIFRVEMYRARQRRL